MGTFTATKRALPPFNGWESISFLPDQSRYTLCNNLKKKYRGYYKQEINSEAK
jgi:hypothetical protein